MSIISDNLIHFLARAEKDSPNQQFNIFKLIFECGLRTANSAIKYSQGHSIFNHIICFTDIPLRECNEHTAVYGKFGIGFTKAFVKNAGGNPARYFVNYEPGEIDLSRKAENRGFVYQAMSGQQKLVSRLGESLNDPEFSLFDNQGREFLSPAQIDSFVKGMIYTMSFDKELGDLGPARDETKEIDLFYKEREWRIVQTGRALKNGTSYKQDENDVHAYYKFGRSDVNMIVVPNEDVRIQAIDFFLSLRSSEDKRLKEFGTHLPPVICYDHLQKW